MISLCFFAVFIFFGPYIKWLCLLAVLLLPMPANATELNTKGYVAVQCTTVADPSCDAASLVLKLNSANPDQGVVVETDFTHASRPNSNWLKKAWVRKKFGDTELRAGRLFLSTGYSQPASDSLITVQRPRSAFRIYAYGVQVSTPVGKGLHLIADVTGPSATTFHDTDWPSTEFSARLSKDSKSGKVALTVQSDRNERRASVNFTYTEGATTVQGLLYEFFPETGQGTTGGYVVVSRKVAKGCEVHAQTDLKSRSDTLDTIGLSITDSQKARLTVDWEMGGKEDRLLGLLLFPF